jgi:hypothetical protein
VVPLYRKYALSNRTNRTFLCVAVLLTACLPGCVRRRMTIRSNPPGAAVYVDDQQVGTTPVGVDFTYYGTRKIQLIKDGYETLTVQQAFSAPWYQWPPLDFFSENLSPWEHRDEHLLNFQLQPQQILPAEELLDRAQELRTNTSRGYAVPLPYDIRGLSPTGPVREGEPYIPPPVLPLPGG